MLGIKEHSVSHTSDHFDLLYDYALQIIKSGNAYVDDTDLETVSQKCHHNMQSSFTDRCVLCRCERSGWKA